MIERWKIKIEALSGDDERTAYAYLPVGYNGQNAYPVMYMFDGHNLFSDAEATYGRSWRLSDYLDYTNTPLIVAAVECNHKGDSRLSEYSPVDFKLKDGGVVKGRGGEYMDWLVTTFKPFIDANFSTLPQREHTLIGGSSMGGLMTLYALCRYNAVFSKGAALSPTLNLWGTDMIGFLQSAKFSSGDMLYADYGSKEFSPRSKSAFAETCALLIKKGLNLTARVVRGGVHSEESWSAQIPYFMHALGF